MPEQFIERVSDRTELRGTERRKARTTANGAALRSIMTGWKTVCLWVSEWIGGPLDRWTWAAVQSSAVEGSTPGLSQKMLQPGSQIP